jgi:hypothetical protein
MPPKKGNPKSPPKGPKPAKVPDSAPNRIQALVKDRDVKLAAEKAAKEVSDRAEAALRDEELKSRLSQDVLGQSDSSQSGVGQSGSSQAGSTDQMT